jgi:NADH-quinone oxidoreductase subunit A
LLSFIFVVILLTLAGYLLSYFLRPYNDTPLKNLPYECGEIPQGEGRLKFESKYYIAAIVFIIFEIEAVLLLPWISEYKNYGIEALLAGLIFLLVLFLGIVYELKKGDLKWHKE